MLLLGLSLALALTGCGDGTTATPPPDGGGPLPRGELLVVGDWGSGTTPQDDVANTMAVYARDREIAAVVTTGDNFYSDSVDELMEPWSWVSEREIPFVVAWGNHDVEGPDRIAAVDEALDRPPRWAVYQWGNIDLVVLDSNQVDSEEQLRFLEETLGSSRDPAIVVFHHPPYTCGEHRDDQDVIEDWVSRFDDDVFLVLNGHDHNYQRFESAGVTYIVSGGGGRYLYDLRPCRPGHPELLAGEAVHHFVVLEQGENEVLATALDSRGEVVDQTRMRLP